MAKLSKFVKLDKNVLLEWIYDTSNIIQENYQVVSNLNTGIRSYISQTQLNNYNNNLFIIDPIIKKYAKLDTDKYNFLKVESYSSSLVQYDKIRIHFPTNFNFYDNDYKGLYFRIFTYDYNNVNQYDFSNYFYDDTIVNNDRNFILNEEFLYDSVSWGKYLTFDLPSIDVISKQRTSSISTNLPIINSINANLTKNIGLSLTAPIFLQFSFINSIQTIFNNKYYFLSDIYNTSISKIPEYMNLAVNINESTDGDYFEIFGTYGGNNESLDEFIDELTSKGRKIKIEYDISLYEENILTNTQTFSVTENFTRKLLYRPIILNSNTTANINVEMKIIDLIDNSMFSRYVTLGLRSNLFKYGKKLSKIDISSNVYKPKIYNLKNLNTTNNIPVQNYNPDINITKVNYPVIVDRVKILAGSSSSNNSDYKSMGNLELIINPFDNFIKFLIGENVDDKGNITPYNLSKVLVNSSIKIVFKSDTEIIEKDIFRESDQNDFEHGIIIYKIEEYDLSTINKIYTNNKNFYLIINSDKSNTKTLLYSGKFILYKDVKFLDMKNNTNTSIFNPNDFNSFVKNLSEAQLQSLLNNLNNVTKNTQNNVNALVFLTLSADVKVFEAYLNKIKANVYLKRAGGNNTSGAYVYFLLNLTLSVIADIKKQKGVQEVVSLEICLGKNVSGTQGTNINDIRNRIVNFNCSSANNA
jgi:hypothetical protein